MSRWLKALPLTLALAALGIVATSCASSRNQAQMRFVHAIPDAKALDVDVYGPQQINGMQLFADVGFRGFLPSAGERAFGYRHDQRVGEPQRHHLGLQRHR